MTATHNPALFEPLQIGAVTAPNRVFMAPMTRSRADNDTDIPGDLSVDYYRQRAGAGLIITEATQVSPQGKGYIATPGIYSDAQIAKWREITDAVHEEGGRIALQLWHVGRISHESLQPGGAQPVSASAVQAEAQTFTANGPEPVSAPRALELEEIPDLIEDFASGARRAIEAGFDLVEVHAANGYLIEQFMADGVNKRTDAYGGPVENRIRLLTEIVKAVANAVGAERTGVRLSPFSSFNDISDSDPEALYAAAIDALDALGLAYLHFANEQRLQGPEADAAVRRLGKRWSGVLIDNGGYSAASAAEAVETGAAEAIAFAKLFLANPDLPRRFQLGAGLNQPDQATFYGGGAEGYIDYPSLDERA